MTSLNLLVLLFALSLASGCGDDRAGAAPTVTPGPAEGDDTTYGEPTGVIITEEGTFVLEGNPDACVEAGACVEVTGSHQ